MKKINKKIIGLLALATLATLTSCGMRVTKPNGGNAQHISSTGSHHMKEVYKPIYQKVNPQK